MDSLSRIANVHVSGSLDSDPTSITVNVVVAAVAAVALGLNVWQAILTRRAVQAARSSAEAQSQSNILATQQLVFNRLYDGLQFIVSCFDKLAYPGVYEDADVQHGGNALVAFKKDVQQAQGDWTNALYVRDDMIRKIEAVLQSVIAHSALIETAGVPQQVSDDLTRAILMFYRVRMAEELTELVQALDRARVGNELAELMIKIDPQTSNIGATRSFLRKPKRQA